MRPGHTVRPKKWSYDSVILFDNGTYSAIWGYFDDGGNISNKRLGVRWNGGVEEKDIGFPKQGKHATWFVEPDPLAKSILLELSNLLELSKNKSPENLANIQKALGELEARVFSDNPPQKPRN
jgi:hypothetical protein